MTIGALPPVCAADRTFGGGGRGGNCCCSLSRASNGLLLPPPSDAGPVFCTVMPASLMVSFCGAGASFFGGGSGLDLLPWVVPFWRASWTRISTALRILPLVFTMTSKFCALSVKPISCSDKSWSEYFDSGGRVTMPWGNTTGLEEWSVYGVPPRTWAALSLGGDEELECP